MRKFLGSLLIVFALVLAIAPWFTDCESHGRFLKTADGREVSMKCHWTGVAELGAALPMALMGIFALRKKNSGVQIGLTGLTASALAILFPTLLIGTCAMATMPCNLLMRPILLSTGLLAAITSSVIFFTNLKSPAPTAEFAAAA